MHISDYVSSSQQGPEMIERVRIKKTPTCMTNQLCLRCENVLSFFAPDYLNNFPFFFWWVHANSVYAVKTCCLFLLLITWITFHSSSDEYMQTHFSCKVVLTGIHWFGHHMQVSHFSSHSTHSLPVSLRLQMVSKWVSMLHWRKAKTAQ